MKVNYDKETDSLYIDLNERKSFDSKEIEDGLVLDFDEKGQIVGIDIQYASTRLDLKNIEINALPINKTNYKTESYVLRED